MTAPSCSCLCSQRPPHVHNGPLVFVFAFMMAPSCSHLCSQWPPHVRVCVHDGPDSPLTFVFAFTMAPTAPSRSQWPPHIRICVHNGPLVFVFAFTMASLHSPHVCIHAPCSRLCLYLVFVFAFVTTHSHLRPTCPPSHLHKDQ
jgi:hypothetical protein